jgi:hypothetical protein
MTHIVLASGQSVSQAVADRVRHLPTVAVGDGFRLAPWAAALVACDSKWWRQTPDALTFAGERWCAGSTPLPVARITPRPGIHMSTNSGLLGLDYWVRRGAKRILLLGIDMQGTHFFGPHKVLANTTPGRFAIFLQQFKVYAATMPADVEVINCSPISALDTFPKLSLDDALDERMAA